MTQSGDAEKGESTMGRILVISVLLLTYLTVVPEAKGWWFMDKFDWLPSECAHKQYPMRLIQGDLLLKDGSSLYVPSKAIINNGWGEIGSTHVVGSTMKSLPVKLKATWFSFAENKFFTGEFILPYDLVLDQFKKGITSPLTGKNTSYNRIIVGFGPEGAVSVWIAVHRVILEVAEYKGREITVPWEAVTSAEMPKEEYIAGVLGRRLPSQKLDELKEHGVPPGISARYSAQYPWNISVSGQKNKILWLKTLNGESEYFDFSSPSIARSRRALPQKVEVDWENHIGRKYEAFMNFDESEVTAAFRKLSEKNGDHPMQLKLEISDDPHVIHTSINDGRYIIRLNKTISKTFTRQ
jgi:hypothetical protein